MSQRKIELFASEFELSHSNIEEKNIMLKMLMDYYQVFLKSLKILSHIDKIIPEVSLHIYLVRTLTFPVP